MRGVRSPDPARGATDDPHTGRLVDGRYRVGSRIARGGMAAVYEAHDLRLDRTIALKIMHAGLGDATADEEDFAARFVREARAAARLSHPHVVAVHDQGEDDGTVYLAMELVPGHTLRDVIAKEAPMPPQRAVALLDPVLQALTTAHEAGLVHRDMKPENVLIADDGRVKVADFGLAKAVSADTQHTATSGILLGTVSYLAPEVVSDGDTDARADVYAVGVMLYELLTGSKPHTGDSPIQVAYAHVHHDVPPPSAVVPDVPDYVDALVARLTARDASLRPADAAVALHLVHRVALALRAGDLTDAELVTDLTPVTRTWDTTPEPLAPLQQDVVNAPPPASEPTAVIAPDRARTRPRRRRGRRAVLALLVLVLVAGLLGGGYWFGWARYVSAPSVVGMTQAAAETELDEAGLAVDYADPVHSETAPAGNVVEADPSAGDRILPDDAVTLTLSLGPERYDVPDVRGMTVAAATDALSEVKMVVAQEKTRYSEEIAEGRVIRTTPQFGTEKAQDLPVDTGITLVVSKGRKPIEVSDWTGRSAEKAEQRMEKQGLEVEVTEEQFSEKVANGAVIDQSPTSGTLYKGDVVKLVVSKGRPFVTLPSVFNRSTDEVVDELESLGLEVKVERARIYFNGSRVFSIDPSAGSDVRKGSTVTITVV